MSVRAAQDEPQWLKPRQIGGDCGMTEVMP